MDTEIDVSANGNGASTEKWYKTKPVLADLTEAVGFQPTEHAIERMMERNISPDEVASAIIRPDTTNSKWNEELNCQQWVFQRGDVRVYTDADTGDIITVADANEKQRTEPRKPSTEIEYDKPAPVLVARKDVDQKLVVAAKASARKATANAYLSKMDAAATREEFEYIFGKHDKEDIRYIDVTPQLAAAMLERNTRNRPKRDRDVDDWSVEQQEGRWLTTHQGVGFDRNGDMVDGQHRLEAIIDSGVTVRMPVAVGLDPAVFDVIDTGRKRSTQDALALLGESRTTIMSSVIRMAYRFDHGMVDPKTRYRVQTSALLDYAKGREEAIREATIYGGKLRGSGRILPSAGGAVHLLLKRELPRRAQTMVDAFLDGVNDGFGLQRGDARAALRRVCGNDQRREPLLHMALILKAWLAFAKGSEVTTLSWRVNEPMPGLFVPPPDITKVFINQQLPNE